MCERVFKLRPHPTSSFQQGPKGGGRGPMPISRLNPIKSKCTNPIVLSCLNLNLIRISVVFFWPIISFPVHGIAISHQKSGNFECPFYPRLLGGKTPSARTVNFTLSGPSFTIFACNYALRQFILCNLRGRQQYKFN